MNRVHVPLPPRWQVGTAPDLLFFACPPRATGWFRTNIALSRHEVPPTASLEDLAATALARTRRIGDDVEVLGERTHRAGRYERYGRLVCFDVGAEGRRVAQLQAIVSGPERSGPGTGSDRDVLHYVASCAFDELDRFGDTFADVLLGIRLGDDVAHSLRS